MKVDRIGFEEDDMGNECGLFLDLTSAIGKRNAVSFGHNPNTYRVKCELQAMIKWIENQEKEEKV